MINGVNAQNSRVSDLFRSVGLNVNNPHFLIMQGRVTKVCVFECCERFYLKIYTANIRLCRTWRNRLHEIWSNVPAAVSEKKHA